MYWLIIYWTHMQKYFFVLWNKPGRKMMWHRMLPCYWLQMRDLMVQWYISTPLWQRHSSETPCKAQPMTSLRNREKLLIHWTMWLSNTTKHLLLYVSWCLTFIYMCSYLHACVCVSPVDTEERASPFVMSRKKSAGLLKASHV